MAPSKPVLYPLKTPKTMTFPSEIHGDACSTCTDTIKQEDSSATPITPPLAYTEFLKALTPVFTSPVSAGVHFPSFPLDSTSRSSLSVPSSATSISFSTGDSFKTTSTSAPPPPSPAPAPQSAKGPGHLRRLRIPPSFMYSPTAQSPQSATVLRSPFSPSDWKIRYFESPRSATGKPVSVRQVVTRTVTYKRTPLDPPPKGKRRKTSDCRDT